VSATLGLIRDMVKSGVVRASEHGRKELAEDGIALRDVLSGLEDATVVEDYPEYIKGPSVLCLQHDSQGKPIHVLWGIAAKTPGTATLITAYRPDPKRWMDDLKTRRPK
jgi:Domain of unknown function (DUF4258)